METVLILVTFAGCLAGLGAGLIWGLRRLLDAVGDTVSKVASETAGSMQLAVSTATEGVLKATMAVIVGGDGEAKQVEVKPEDNPAAPEWMMWEGDEADDDITGPGDSVYVDERRRDGAALIREGESMVPGVPLPDMGAEMYEPMRGEDA